MSDRQSCLFCRIADGDVPSTRVHEDDWSSPFATSRPRRRPTSSSSLEPHRLGGGPGRCGRSVARSAVRGRGGPGPVGRRGGRRVSARLERRGGRRSVRAPPASPPVGAGPSTGRPGEALGPSIAGLLVVGSLAIALAGCSPTDGAAVTYPVGSVGPDRTVSPAVAQTRGQLVSVPGRHRTSSSTTPCRRTGRRSPRRSPRPRGPSTRSTLPADPNGGFIVVYEFADTGQAAAAAAEQQAYLGTGPGAVQ